MLRIVNFTMFKSGTHLIREIIKLISGYTYREPEIKKGENNYEDQTKFFLASGKAFFSWHLHPLQETNEIILNSNAKSIYIVRNIFDQTISIYNHFAKNVDSELGRGRNVDYLFKERSYEEGLGLIINGCDIDGFRWLGLEHQLLHLNRLYKSSIVTKGLFLSFENLIFERQKSILRIADYLGISDIQMERIIAQSDFNYMKKHKFHKSHFQTGKVGKIFEEENFLNLLIMVLYNI